MRHLSPLVLLVACVGGSSGGGETPSTRPATTTSAVEGDEDAPYEGILPEVTVRATSEPDHIFPLADGYIAMVGTTPAEIVFPDGTSSRQSPLDAPQSLWILGPDGRPEASLLADRIVACASDGRLFLAVRDDEATTVLGQPLPGGVTTLFSWTPADGTAQFSALDDPAEHPAAIGCSPSSGRVALVTSATDPYANPERVWAFTPDGGIVYDHGLNRVSGFVAMNDAGDLALVGNSTFMAAGPHRVDALDGGYLDSLAIGLDATGDMAWDAVVSGGTYDLLRTMGPAGDGTFLWVAGDTSPGALIFDGTGARHQPFDDIERAHHLRLDIATGALLDAGQTEAPTRPPLAYGDRVFLSIDTMTYPGPLHDLPNEAGFVLFALDDALQPLAVRTLIPEALQELPPGTARWAGADAADEKGLWVIGATHLAGDDPEVDHPVVVARLPWPDLE